MADPPPAIAGRPQGHQQGHPAHHPSKDGQGRAGMLRRKVKSTGLTQTLGQLYSSLIGMLSQTAGSTEKLSVNPVHLRFRPPAPTDDTAGVARPDPSRNWNPLKPEQVTYLVPRSIGIDNVVLNKRCRSSRRRRMWAPRPSQRQGQLRARQPWSWPLWPRRPRRWTLWSWPLWSRRLRAAR
jgi:hypothetical protein